jgi:hypothetical protein
MPCKNKYLLTLLILVLLYFVLTKPIKLNSIENMYGNNDKSESTLTPSSTYTYGDAPLIYNSDPSNMNYYRIGSINNSLSIPNSQVLTNKALYEYSTTVIPKEKNLLRYVHNDTIMSKLGDDTHCCDDIMNKAMIYNYLYDNARNRYISEQESYFD